MPAPGVYFAIYYEVADGAFQRAAQTWELEVMQECTADAPFLSERVITASDFGRAWRSVAGRSRDTGLPVMRGQIFSHASKGYETDGLEFQAGADDQDGTLSKSEIAALPQLNWSPDGLLILAGCNTGNAGTRGWTPAESFAKSQGVKTIGQAGYSYFSRCYSSYSQIDDHSQTVHLWAYRRGKNAKLGWGARMPGISFSP